jgi:nicotinamidase-related amidase
MFHFWNMMSRTSSLPRTSFHLYCPKRAIKLVTRTGDWPMTTTFTPENSALVLIDHQVGTMQLIKNIDVAQARRMSLALAKTARILGIPTVLTSSQEDRVQGPLLHELKDILPDAFEKRIKREGIVNAWTDTNFKAAIEATGRKN